MKNTKENQNKIYATVKAALLDLFQRTEKERAAPTKIIKLKKRIPKDVDISKFIVERKLLPQFMQDESSLKGVCVGACAYSGLWKNSPPHSAHAHTRGKVARKYDGWICFQNEKSFLKETTQQHELAHIISNSGHTARWARAYEKLVDGKKKWLTFEWLQNKYKFKDKKVANEPSK